MTLHERAAAIADRIQAELERLGRWSKTPLDPARLVDMGPFGMTTLAPEEWIQFVLVPRVRELVATRGRFPAESETAVWATRQFAGDRDTGLLVAVLRELDELSEGGPSDEELVQAGANGDVSALEALIDRGRPIPPRALIAAVGGAHHHAVLLMLEHRADPSALDARGISPLHVAAAGGSPLLPALLASPFDVDLASIEDTPTEGPYSAIATALLEAGADANVRAEPSGITPLMVAMYFGRRDVTELLLARGADPARRDTFGRTAERFPVFPIIARVIRLCRRIPVIQTAYVAQIHAPHSHQFTTPVLGLELTAALPADAFTGWPETSPVVVFALGDDAVSRLVRLAAPVYSAPAPTSSRAIADAIAGELDGTVRDAPSRDHTVQYAIALADGRVPVLVRDFGHALGVGVAGERQWHLLATADTSAIVPDVAATARAWAASHATTATIVDIALDLATALTAELGERWTIGIPGTPEPTEMWLHGANHDAAAVGVFAGAVKVFVDGESRSMMISGRSDLSAARAHVIANVREQLRHYERNAALSDRIRIVTTELTALLAHRFPRQTWSSTTRGFVMHDHAISASIACGTETAAHEVVAITSDGDALRGHAGLVGPDGWDGELGEPAAALDAIAQAVERSLATLTIERLAIGSSYRVLEPIQELEAGAVVRYTGYDDIDNHYGRYVFVTRDGREVAVSGDGSTPRSGPLGEVHRYLTEVLDP